MIPIIWDEAWDFPPVTPFKSQVLLGTGGRRDENEWLWPD